MGASEIIALVVGVVVILSAVAGVWWRVEAKIGEAKAEALAAAQGAQSDASAALARIAALHLHVAETYVTKAGMTEQTTQIMRAIHDVGNDVRQLNERIDRMIERRPTQ